MRRARLRGRGVMGVGWLTGSEWVCGAMCCALCSASAQDALRNQRDNASATTQTRAQVEGQPYTVRWGDFTMLSSASLGVEWVDNVNLTSDSPEGAFILRPMLTAAGVWPITDRNSFRVSVGVSYDKYFGGDQDDRFNISPQSQLAWDFFVKDVRINLHDRFSYQTDPLNEGALSGVGQYGNFQNSAGVTTTWNASEETALTIGYDHVTYIAEETAYSYQDRNSDFGYGSIGTMLHPALQVGLETSGGSTAYTEHIYSGMLQWSAGLSTSWQLSPYFNVEGRGGYVTYTFTEPALVGGTTGYSTYYLELRIRHRIHERLTYTLDASRDTQGGINSQLTSRWEVGAHATWRALEKVSLTAGVFYEKAAELGGFFTDAYNRFGVDLGTSYQLMERLTSSLTYQITTKTSEIPGRDYVQNRITLALSYRF